jgi:hypothetical protein
MFTSKMVELSQSKPVGSPSPLSNSRSAAPDSENRFGSFARRLAAFNSRSRAIVDENF